MPSLSGKEALKRTYGFPFVEIQIKIVETSKFSFLGMGDKSEETDDERRD